MAFAKLNAFMRKSAQCSFEGLHAAAAAALDSFSPTHCSNLFRHENYGPG
jgi:hypothetical protein